GLNLQNPESSQIVTTPLMMPQLPPAACSTTFSQTPVEGLHTWLARASHRGAVVEVLLQVAPRASGAVQVPEPNWPGIAPRQIRLGWHGALSSHALPTVPNATQVLVCAEHTRPGPQPSLGSQVALSALAATHKPHP